MDSTHQTEHLHKPSWWRTSKIWWFIAGVAVLAALIVVVIEERGRPAPTPYGAFLDQLEDGNVASVTFSGTEINGRFKRPLDGAQRDTFSSRVPDFGDPALIPEMRKRQVVIDVASPSQWTSLLARIPWPLLLFFGAAIIAGVVRLMRGGKAQSGFAGPTTPAPGMIGLAARLFTKKDLAARPPAHDIDEQKGR